MLEELLENHINLKYYRKIAYKKNVDHTDFANRILLDKETAEEIITNLLSIKYYNDKSKNVTIKILDGSDE